MYLAASSSDARRHPVPYANKLFLMFSALKEVFATIQLCLWGAVCCDDVLKVSQIRRRLKVDPPLLIVQCLLNATAWPWILKMNVSASISSKRGALCCTDLVRECLSTWQTQISFDFRSDCLSLEAFFQAHPAPLLPAPCSVLFGGVTHLISRVALPSCITLTIWHGVSEFSPTRLDSLKSHSHHFSSNGLWPICHRHFKSSEPRSFLEPGVEKMESDARPLLTLPITSAKCCRCDLAKAEAIFNEVRAEGEFIAFAIRLVLCSPSQKLSQLPMDQTFGWK
jgi:hypothetical protein